MSTILREKVSDELKAIRQQMTDYHDAVNFMNQQFEDLKNVIDLKSKIITKLETDNASLQASVKDISARLNLTEQHMRESNLEINGIPEHKSENLVNTIVQLSKTIDCSLRDDDILNVTRVAKLSNTNDRPRCVIAKLRSPRHRDSILAAVTTFNKRNQNDKLNSHHLGIGGSRVPVYVAEHLTPNNKSLHAATRQKAKEQGYKFVWIRNGRIFVRKTEACQAILIKSLDSLKAM